MVKNHNNHFYFYFEILSNSQKCCKNKTKNFILPLTIFHKSLFDTPSPMNTLAHNFSKETVLHNHNLVIKIRKLTLIYDYCQILRSHSGFFACPMSCIAEGTIQGSCIPFTCRVFLIPFNPEE